MGCGLHPPSWRESPGGSDLQGSAPCLHTRGRQSARTAVKLPWTLRESFAHCLRPPHQLLLPDMPVMLAMGVGVGDSGHRTISERPFILLFLPHSLALWQPDSKMGRFELTMNKSSGQNQLSRVQSGPFWKGRVLGPQLEINSPFSGFLGLGLSLAGKWPVPFAPWPGSLVSGGGPHVSPLVFWKPD